MLSPAQKIRSSSRHSLFLIALTCFSSFLLIDRILSLTDSSPHQYPPTKSAGVMLQRSQLLLAKEVTLEPTALICASNLSNSSKSLTNVTSYPFYIVVKSRAVSSGELFQRRIFTRMSWAREARSMGIPVIYALGRPYDEQTQIMIEYEHKIHDDILQFNYIDAYYNVSIKTTGILHWFVTRHCDQTAPYVFIVDDDVLINLSTLSKMISTGSFRPDTLYGLYLTSIEPHPSGKWAVSLEDYPLDIYPDFLIGMSTLYPTNLIHSLVNELFRMAYRNESIFFLDDVLITGIVAERLNIPRASMPGLRDCSHVDLLKNTVIGECSHVRRIHVWSKFSLSRHLINTFESDRLIEMTNYEKWRGDFKQTRNGTSIHSEANMNRSLRFLPFVLPDSQSNTTLLLLLTFAIVFIIIYIFRNILYRYVSEKKSPLNSTPIKKTSSAMLLVPVK